MLSIFKKKDDKSNKPDSVSKDTPAPDNEVVSDEILTNLSIHPEQEISVQEKYICQYYHAQLKPLKKNQISISGYQLNKYEGYFVVHAFIRSTLEKPIKITDVTLLLLDENKKGLAKKEFNLGELGELPPNSSRPWIFIFNNEDTIGTEIPDTGWQLAFEISKKQSRKTPLDLHESWESSCTEEQKHFLLKLVEELPPLQQEEVNILGIEAIQTENQDLHVSLLFRNATAKNVQLQQLPIQITNGNDELITRGIFNLDSFEIKANTAKPWRFIFPAELLVNKHPDLTAWKVTLTSQNNQRSEQGV
jgi:accessory Sec system S-layer assembly protein